MRLPIRQLVDQRVFVILALELIVLTVAVPGFASGLNVQNVLQRAAPDGLMAVGMTLVILEGQLDLSIGSTFALAGLVAIGLQPVLGTYPAILVGSAVGPVVGLINGILVARVGLNSFIATLGMMIGVRGLTFLLSAGPVSGSDLNIGPIVDGSVLGPVTFRSAVFLLAAALAALVLARTGVGRGVYAVGGNAELSRLAGLDPRRYLIAAFVMSGLTASIAGVLLSLSVNTGSPTFGQAAVITVISAVVVGGTSLLGGEGGVIQTVGGILILAALGSGLDRFNVPVYYQSIVTGLLLIVVVLVDSVISRRRAEAAGRRPRVRAASSVV